MFLGMSKKWELKKVLMPWWSVLVVEKPEYPEKTTDLSQVTDKLDPIKLYRQLSNVKYIGINKDNA
jgi:hypothetical protein